MGHTLGQAAKAAGVSKTTIHRSIARGRLPASRNADGSYAIDPAALAQVFPGERSVSDGLLVAQAQRDQFRVLAEDRDATIRDLRARLDAETEERRRVQTQLTELLTELRPDPSAATPAPEARRQRWFGGG